MRASGKRGSHRGHSLSAAAALGLAVAVVLSPAAQAKPKFVTFSIGDDTRPTSINSKGAVTGVWYLNGAHGFVRQTDGTIETFDVAGAQNTYPTSINKKGEVTGYYNLADKSAHGFLRKADGTIRTFKLPHDNNGDYPLKLNPTGIVIGYYMKGRIRHGFIRGQHGQLTTFDCPCGQTFVTAGNDLEAATGAGVNTGFIRNPDGTFTLFNAGQFTEPLSISNSGAVAGTIGDGDTLQGFVRAADGSLAIFNAAASDPTTATAINSGGTSTGYFLEIGIMYHGFVRVADGTITAFDPVGSVNTESAGINDKGAITGFYVDQANKGVGFIRNP